MGRHRTDGEDDEINTTGDFGGFFPSVRDIIGIQGVPLDQDGLSRIKIGLDGGVIVKYLGISQKEDYGSTVACTSSSKVTPRCREKQRGLTK